MNERIRQLAEQAWDATAVGPEVVVLVSFAEKFAQLIVRECAGQCLSDDCMRILNHFGVRE